MPIKIMMPQLSPTMEVGTLARWLVKEGDDVTSGDVLAEVETDKATMEVETIDDGRIARILVPEGTENIPVNRTIAWILEEGEDEAALDDAGSGTDEAPAADVDEPADTPAAEATEQVPPEADEPPAASGERPVKASPLARSMARQAGLALGDLVGSGPGGRIVKRDVEAALAAGDKPPSAPSPAGRTPASAQGAAFEEVAVSGMRRIIAERLQESKQTIPHFYLTVDCDLDRLLDARRQLNSDETRHKLSVNDFVIRALALALTRVPEANAMWGGDVIRRFATADISVAVAVEDGLVTPVIRDAGNKNLAGISVEMRDFAERARAGKLLPEEYQGGSFTLSNLGMYGIRQFDAVINPPQAGILAVGAGEPRPVVRDGAPAVATMMSCTLSCDHRVIDGAMGARLLTAFRDCIENPLTML